MIQEKGTGAGRNKRFAAAGAIFLAFIVGLEIVIMISPFAFFFYAAFNPFLLALNQSSMTRWLTAFFLPHMVVPPNGVLIVVRVIGSVFFLVGMLIFFICAVQVYMGKLLKKGVAAKGFYAIIRHPQYLGLGLAALGLAIMWPRFLTLTLFAIMLFLYYLLAKDEERRMINHFGESYMSYMGRTGMFLPCVRKKVFPADYKPSTLRPGKAVAIFVVLLVVVVGSGFISRIYTIHHLPLGRIDNIDVIAITEEDLKTAKDLLPSVLQDPTIAAKLKPIEQGKTHRLLAYYIPVDYVMQGMIADTGEQWKLFEQHKTLGMITEYILHPFAHLTGGHSHHAVMKHPHAGMPNPDLHNSPAMKRRIIFIGLSSNRGEIETPFDDFGINITRTPLFFVDVHLHTREILHVQDTPSGSGWGTVPTPMF
jgi:protein-S-isoprenylcysteine O-methyltransferase Ste14